MKWIYLLRHAKAGRGDLSLDDQERNLSSQGRLDAARMGQYLAANQSPPDAVLCSESVRTRETLSLLDLNIAPANVFFEKTLYLADAKTLVARLCDVPDNYQRILLIGHAPGLAELALRLVSSSSEKDGRLANNLVTRFSPAAFALIESNATAWDDLLFAPSKVQTFLTPDDIEAKQKTLSFNISAKISRAKGIVIRRLICSDARSRASTT